MQLQVNDEQLAAVVAGAVMQVMGEEERDRIIGEAIRYLMTAAPQKNSWDPPNKSPLQQAFERATFQQAETMAREYLANDPTFNEQFKVLIGEAVHQVFTLNREDTVSRIARSIRDGLHKD